MRNKLNKTSIIISYISVFVSIIGTFFVTPLILENIGDSNYGLYSFCTSLTSWLTILTIAVGSSYVYFANRDIEDTGNDNKTNTLFLRLFIFVGVIILLAVCIIFPFLYFSNIQLFNYTVDETKLIFILLGISSIQIIFSILFNFFHLYLIAKEHFFFVRFKNLLIEIILYGLLLGSAFLFKSIIAVAISSVVTTLLSGILNLIMVYKLKSLHFYHPKQNEFKGKYKQILSYVLFVLINTLITTINNNLDKTILGAMVGSSFVTMYQLSFSFTSYLTLMTGSISETYMPQIHSSYRDESIDKANNLFLLISKIQIIFLLFIVGGFASVGYEFVCLWVGKERIAIYSYSVVLLLLTLVPLTSLSAVDCERANNKHKFRAIVMLIFAVINVAISITLIFIYGADYAIWSCIIGTAFSKILSEWIILPIYDFYVLRLPIKDYYLYLIKIFSYSLIAFIVSFCTRYLLINYLNTFFVFLIEGFVYVIIYLIFIVLFDRKIIVKFIRGKFNEESIEKN